MNWYFAGGDLGFYWKEHIQSFSWLPQILQKNEGFGFNGLLSLWLDYPFHVVVKVLSTLGLSWFIIEKVLWICVFALAIYSSYKLTKSLIGSLVYTANTYFLLLFTGGQLGVAFAYAFSPFVLYTFQNKNIIVNGLWLALLILFDIRIAYLMVAAIVLMYIVEKKLRQFLNLFFSLLIAASVHLYWILPTVFAGQGFSGIGKEFTSPGMLSFLSFADFSHAISFLHPNWPENLFGKVYFLQPEFLVIPVIAFAALQYKENKLRLYALLSIIGVFFAKGVHEPFGQIFTWMFTYVPGFVMFRDPTKFYVYIALGYSFLIPYFLQKINKKIIVAVFIIFWLFTLRGFKVQTVGIPQEYIKLKQLLVSDPVPSRTLWIPGRENFAFHSETHPILVATSAAAIDSSVRYVIVPIDTGKRLFLNDYTFDPSIREDFISGITLPRDPRFQDLAVFENPQFQSMHAYVEPLAIRQQSYANLGLGMSVGFLIIWLLWIFLH